jgi:predicted transcriptional regulator of viral defense system
MIRRASGPRLSDFLDALQARGRYTFERSEALAELRSSPEALEVAARRLASKGRLVLPRRGFYVIVPVEYRVSGAPPVDWFIDDLMRFEGRPYYVALLSAAALHGAAHHQPQEFQVITDAPLRPTAAGRGRLRFFTKLALAGTPALEVRTQTGTMRVSTPEATALDLVRYARWCGQLGNVATVLADLAEKLDRDRLVSACRTNAELANAQRLGWLLDKVGQARVARPLADWVAARHPRVVKLDSAAAQGEGQADPRWRVVANAEVEVDR